MTHPGGTDKVAFTGSTDTGKRIMALCAERIRRVSLELGGKSAAIVCDDADLDAAMPRLVGGGMHLSGQVCGAHTRILVSRTLRRGRRRRGGRRRRPSPTATRSTPGRSWGRSWPSASATGSRVHRLGAGGQGRAAAGGAARAPPQGWYVPPTILADVHNGMRVARDEIFGPVLSFIPFDGETTPCDRQRLR